MNIFKHKKSRKRMKYEGGDIFKGVFLKVKSCHFFYLKTKMLISFFLFSFCSCEFWFFRTNHFESLIKNSYSKPIFIVAYSSSNSESENIPEETRKFRQLTDKRKDFYFTTVNCEDGWKCYSNAFNVPKTPYFALIQGKQQSYWIETKTNTSEEWLKFVDSLLKPNLVEIKNDAEISDLTKNMSAGGSVFLLQIAKESSKRFKEYKELAKINQIYGCKFAYKLSLFGKQKILAYTSPNCYVQSDNIEKLSLFIEKNKYGALHKFTSDELPSLIAERKSTALLLVEKPYSGPKITDDMKNDISDLSDKFCGKMKVGWAALDYGDEFAKNNNIKSEDLPALVFFNHKCVNKYVGRFGDSYNTDFFNISLSGELCDQIYNNMDGSQNITSFNSSLAAKKGMWWQTTVSGSLANVLYLAICFSVLLYVVIRTPIREKVKER